MNSQGTVSTSATLPQRVVNAVWPFLTGRRGLLLLAAAFVAAGLALSWGWFVAIGVAPLLLAVLPCALMCGLGLCMSRAGGGPGANGGGKDDDGSASR